MNTITRVRRLADLPDDLADNLRSWPHCWRGTDSHEDDLYGGADGRTWDRMTTEGPRRTQMRLTGYADAGTTADGYRLFVLRFDAARFTYGYMTPGSTRLTIGGDDDYGTKASVEEWVRQQMTLDLAAAREAGVVAYNVGRPNLWREYHGYGQQHVVDPRMARLVEGVWGLARERLGAAFSAAWEDQAAHDRALDARKDAERATAREAVPA